MTLDDNVLLEIFNFYIGQSRRLRREEDRWHTLVHVCRQWRQIIFASPHRLNLRLLCTRKRLGTLDVWSALPALPIVVDIEHGSLRAREEKKIVAKLNQRDRVCKIRFWCIPDSPLRKIIEVMKEPFPALTDLKLSVSHGTTPVPLPDSFLGGSSPRLHSLELSHILFPELPKLLSSATDLVTLCLTDIPRSESGYISPEAMVTALSALKRLKTLHLQFQFPQFRESQSPPPRTRVTLPALTLFRFKGNSDYLEDTVSRIDTPLLDIFSVKLFNQLVFDIPLVREFIDRTETFKASHRADVIFHEDRVNLTIFSRGAQVEKKSLELGISCKPFDWQLSSLAEVCGSCLPPLPTLESLEVRRDRKYLDDIETVQWVDLLRPFASVKSLILDDQVARLVAPALQELTGESVTEVLPALQNLFLRPSARSRPIQEAVAQFVTARQLSEHPVVVHYQDQRIW